MARQEMQIHNQLNPGVTVAELFAGVASGVGAMKGMRVEWAGPGTLIVVHRYCPGWALLLGFLGLFLMLIGMLFFLIKTEDRITIVAQDTSEGARLTVTGFGDVMTKTFLSDFLAPGLAAA